jgi:hypothetical protein
MKSILISCTIIALIVSANGYSQNFTVKDSIQIFSDSLFSKLENNYLFKSKVQWSEIKTRFQKKALQHSVFEKSLGETTAVFDSIGCEHCMLFSDKGYYPATQRPLLFEDYTPQFVKKYQSGVKFSVSKIADNYGYIVIPGMLFNDLPKDSLNLKAQEMYNQITALNKHNKIKGWIIDLRFNIGGDAFLMLTTLYHFLGDKVVYKLLDINKDVSVINKLKNGKFYSGDKIEMEINTRNNKVDNKIPVALIIGNWTASAGEDVVLGFKGRKNVLIIGESTYGFLTGNDMFTLPFNVKAPLTTGYIADMYGNYSKNLKPDIYIQKKDNFDNLLQDQNIIEAIKFINSSSN